MNSAPPQKQQETPLARASGRVRAISDAYRERAFLPIQDEIEGVPVRHMTARQLNALQAIRSPFIYGGMPTAEEVAAFLWFISPLYNAAGNGRDEFTMVVGQLDYIRTLITIRKYLDRTFLDLPGAPASGKSFPISSTAGLVDDLAEAYGWSEETILDMPLVRVLQYVKRQRSKKNPEAPVFDKLVDRLRDRYYRRKTARKSVNG